MDIKLHVKESYTKFLSPPTSIFDTSIPCFSEYLEAGPSASKTKEPTS